MFKWIKSLFIKNKPSLALKSGLIPDKEDSRDHIKNLPLKVGATTKCFSLRKYIPGGILNQRSTGACTGYAAAQAMNILVNRMLELMNKTENVKFISLSPIWLYYNARKYDNCPVNRDDGASLRSVIKSLKNPGAVHMDAMNQDYSVTTPPPEGIEKLPMYKIAEYARIFSDENTIELMQRTLDTEHLPILCGVKLYQDSVDDSYYNGGIIKYDNVMNDTFIGGHALCVIGYKLIDNVLYFECVNSWGSLYGDSGFCYLPAFVFNSDYVFDIWTFDRKYF